jgi:hypothetical protein
MADTRTPRDLVSRDKNARDVYVPPSALPDPTPEPGMTYRYIMTHVLGRPEPTRVSMMMREGWVPVKIEDHPELGLSGSGNVEIGGLMLCKMPTERAQSRANYYNQQAQTQMDAVDNSYLKNNDPRMPLFADRKSTSSSGQRFGSGSK